MRESLVGSQQYVVVIESGVSVHAWWVPKICCAKFMGVKHVFGGGVKLNKQGLW